jgi:hypothetical protein
MAFDPTGLNPFVDSCDHFDLVCWDVDAKIGTACALFGGSDLIGCIKVVQTEPGTRIVLAIVPTPNGGFAVVAMSQESGPPVGGGGDSGGGGGRTRFDKHILDMLARRGWTIESVLDTIANAFSTRAVRDTRFDPVTGLRNNDPATAFINADGSYVVRNNITGEIVQISNRNNPFWKVPF